MQGDVSHPWSQSDAEWLAVRGMVEVHGLQRSCWQSWKIARDAGVDDATAQAARRSSPFVR